MYILLYNYYTTVFINLWTRTESPHKIASLVTSRNIHSFSASTEMVLLYFLKTKNVYGYLVTPLSRRYYKITISPPFLRLPLYIIHFNIYYLSPTHHLCTRKIPSETFSQKMLYLYTFDPTYILRLCP